MAKRFFCLREAVTADRSIGEGSSGVPCGGSMRHVALRTASRLLLPASLVVSIIPAGSARAQSFPPPGEDVSVQDQRAPDEVGLAPGIVVALRAQVTAGRWTLWRHGWLVHVEGDFNQTAEIKSARKTVHAAIVGASLLTGNIPSIDQRISEWNPELTGFDADATWWHVMTQTSAFDEPTLAPGELWAYSDANPHQLCRAVARAWGQADYDVDYRAIAQAALLGPIGASGYDTLVRSDGIRFVMDLEDLGRVGLLLVTGGAWDGVRVIPEWFVDMIGTKQTYGIPPNYDNANDGHTELLVSDFPESPYGLFTWTNTDQDLYPLADSTWSVALGSGGHYLVWNRDSGVVFAAQDASFATVPGETRPGWPIPVRAAVETMQANIVGPNPLVATAAPRSPARPTFVAVPNPFVESVVISFSREATGHVDLAVYDVRGGLVRRLRNDAVPRGAHWIRWDGHDARGRPVAAGVYFVRLVADDTAHVSKVVRQARR